MSDKTWIEGEHGLYTVRPTRGASTGRSMYRARVWIPSQRKFAHFKAGSTLRQARRRLGVIMGDPEAALAARAEKRTTSLTFAQVVDRFVADYRTRGGTGWPKEITRAAREHFGDLPANQVTTVALDGYAKARRALKRLDGGPRVSESTLRKELIALGTLFRWAKRRGLVQANPADAELLPLPKESTREARPLTDDELTGLLSLSEPWLRSVIAWATETGMDRGRILSLRWTELDLDRADGRIVADRFAMLRGKTGKPIRQVLSVGALNRAAKLRHASGVVFLDT
jgi:integrase